MRKSISILALAALCAAAGGVPAFSQSKEAALSDLNARIKSSKGKWTAGETSVSGIPNDEFKGRLLNSSDMSASMKMAGSLHKLPMSADAVTEPSLDWGAKGIQTPVRDQGHCGSCWAFSMAGAEELQLLIKKPEVYGQPGAEVTRSVQALVSCDTKMKGCNGGTLNASYLVDKGLPAESAYPYGSGGGGSAKACGEGAADGWQGKTEKIADWGSVNGDVGAIKNALAQYGPIPSTMMVFDDFKSYKSGVYTKTDGAKYLGGHAILIVGYDDGAQALIVKNSWNTGWGEGGYFRIAYSEVQCSLWDMLFGHKRVNFGCVTIGYNMKKAGPDASGKDQPVLSEDAAQKALGLLKTPLL